MKFDFFSGVSFSVIPDIPPGKDSNPVEMKFEYKTSAQLIDTVVVLYCMKGSATINITGHPEDSPIILKPSTPTYKFYEMTVTLNQTGRVSTNFYPLVNIVKYLFS